MNKQIVFLTYLNRSGSTLLSKKLDEFDSIDVGIEEDFPDGIRRGKVSITNKDELREYLNVLSSSKKYDYWDINIRTLEEHLMEEKFPLTYGDVLSKLLEIYFSKSLSSVVLHKKSLYFLYHSKIRRLFPSSKMIFIARDPRAIYNSQRKSTNSTDGKQMQNSIFHFAMNYKISMSFLSDWVNRSYFLLLRYEDLLRNEDVVVNQILNFLSVDRKKGSKPSYFDKIPESQLHLHSNVKEGTNKLDRIDAWTHELATFEQKFLQIVLSSEIERFRYLYADQHLSFISHIKLYIMVIGFWILYPVKRIWKSRRFKSVR